MQANQFRIGNILSLHSHEGYLGDAYLKAESIVIAQNDIKLFEATYCPFKITIQWLIDLGFDWVEGMGYILDGFVIDFITEGGARFTFSQPAKEYHTVIIKYVHELQNLWFALTGEELVVSEKSSRTFMKNKK